MSTTQIPPSTSSTPPPRRPPGGDLYDASYWESAYRGLHDAPALLIQLQDDLSRSRRREAFWISVAVHLVVVLLLVNSEKLARLMPRGTGVVVSPSLSAKDKDVTYLELPTDAQKVAKRPDTNIISDKDRIATSKAPQLDRQELKKILDASRAGRPGPIVPAAQQASAPDQTMAQGPAAPQQQGLPPTPNLNAKLQTPPAGAPNSVWANAGAKYPGAAIDQAARATAANRGGVGGDNGDYGLGLGRKATARMGPWDVLTDTMGVDFGPYLQRVLRDVKLNWYHLIPESAMMKKGKVTIEFAILKDGSVGGLKIVESSGDVPLDRAAFGGITSSNPFQPLPTDFAGQYLGLRFAFYYNLPIDQNR